MPSILSTISNILTSALPCCLLALGIFLTFRILDFADLTAEGSFLVGAALTGAVHYLGGNPFLATFVGCLGGAACGFITGCLNRFCKISKLLSGIITMTATGSIVMLIMGLAKGSAGGFDAQIPLNIQKNDTIFSLFWNDYIENTVMDIIVMAVIVVLVVIAIYFFFGTEYGMAIRATGLNENMARSQGINTTAATIVGVTISNALIGLGGALYAQDTKSVSTQSAIGYLVIGLASIIIGEVIFGRRSFKNWIISVCLGSITYFIISSTVVNIGLPTQLKNLLYAILIVIALCLPAIKKGVITLWFKVYNKVHKKEELEDAETN